MVGLVKRYGEDWARPVLVRWCNPDPQWRGLGGRDRLAWLTSLARLCEALRAADEAVGTRAARLLLGEQWGWLKERIERLRGSRSPSRRDEALASLAKPLLGFLESTAVVEANDLRGPALGFLTDDRNEALVPGLVQTLRAADNVTPARRAEAGLDNIARHCTRRIEAQLALPARSEEDWSITFPDECRCELCKTLGVFLADPRQSRLEWPLAKNGRRHVHQTLDFHELPVQHQTRRSGRPFTLVLTKTRRLFEDEARERSARQADLEWLADWPGSAAPLAAGARRK